MWIHLRGRLTLSSSSNGNSEYTYRWIKWKLKKKHLFPIQPTKKKKKKRKRRHASNCGTKEPRRVTETRLEWQHQGKVILTLLAAAAKLPEEQARNFQRPLLLGDCTGRTEKSWPADDHGCQSSDRIQEAYQAIDQHSTTRGSIGRGRSLDGTVPPGRRSSTVFTHDHEHGFVPLPGSNHRQLNPGDSCANNNSWRGGIARGFQRDAHRRQYVGKFLQVSSAMKCHDRVPHFRSRWNLLNQTLTRPLLNIDRWQRSLNPKDENDPHHHDVAILVTRKNICSTHGCSWVFLISSYWCLIGYYLVRFMEGLKVGMIDGKRLKILIWFYWRVDASSRMGVDETKSIQLTIENLFALLTTQHNATYC